MSWLDSQATWLNLAQMDLRNEPMIRPETGFEWLGLRGIIIRPQLNFQIYNLISGLCTVLVLLTTLCSNHCCCCHHENATDREISVCFTSEQRLPNLDFQSGLPDGAKLSKYCQKSLFSKRFAIFWQCFFNAKNLLFLKHQLFLLFTKFIKIILLATKNSEKLQLRFEVKQKQQVQ